jgi:two-component system, LytTR family, response regulator
MEQMKCIIIDDNPIARVVTRELLNQISFLEILAEFSNPFEAIEYIQKHDVDLLLLDIEMPKMTGLQFLKHVENHPLTILITSNPNYALEAHEYNIVDFLVTPINEDRFLKSILRAQNILKSQQKIIDSPSSDDIAFFIKEKTIISKIETKHILFLQSYGDYVKIHTTSKNYTVRLNLKVAETKLPSKQFVRVHRSYMVAVDKIESIEENEIKIGNHLIPLGDNYKTDFLNKLNFL